MRMDLRGKSVSASTALILVIDTSGSMGGGPGGASKMDLAKEAAISAAELLGEYDQIGIVAFEDQPRWVIPPTPATDLGVVQAAICRDAARRRHRDLPGAQAWPTRAWRRSTPRSSTSSCSPTARRRAATTPA